MVLEKKIYVYNFQTMKLQEKFDTCENPRGIVALNGSKDMCVLAGPLPELGHLRIIHFDQANKTVNIFAHLAAVSAIALNHDGNLLGTSSTKGQVIRLYATETG